MAWLGETFGDGLNSIKGKLTQLTNEVLSDDPLATTSFEGRIKELEDNCKSHLTEIEKLKQENQTLKRGRSFDLSDQQIQNVCQLENQLMEVTFERDSLKQSVEDLDAVHQLELQVLIKDRETLRQTVESLKRKPPDCNGGSDLPSLQELRLENDISREEGKLKDKKIESLEGDLKNLNETISRSQIDFDQRIQFLESEKSQLSGLLKSNSSQLELLSTERDRLHDELNALQSDVIKGEDSEKDIAQLNKSVEAAEMENKLLKSKLKNWEKLIKQYNKKELQIAKLLGILTDPPANDLMTQIISAVSDVQKERENLKNSLSDREHDIADIAPAETLCASLQEKIEDLEADNREKEKLCAALSEALSGTKIDNERAMSKCKELDTQLFEISRRHQEEIKNLEADNKEKEKLCAELSEDLSGTKIDNERLMAKCKELDTQLCEISRKHEDNVSGSSSRIEQLEAANGQLTIQLQNLNADLENNKELLTASDTTLRELSDQNKNLEDLLTAERNSNNGLIVPREVMAAVEEEVTKMVQAFGLSEPNQDVVASLKGVNDRLNHVLAEQRERSIAVNGTLRLEIGKLKGVVNRIRREFLRSSDGDSGAGLIDWGVNADLLGDRTVGADHLIQSQTDDVKRLKQDVAQMTEIIRMIDDGLTAIYQDKSRLESELTVLKSVSSKTEKELLANIKIKEQLESDKLQHDKLIETKDKEIQAILSAKEKIESEFKTVKEEKDEMVNFYKDELSRLQLSEGLLNVHLEKAKNVEAETKKEGELLQQSHETQVGQINTLVQEVASKEETIRQLSKTIESLQRGSVEDVVEKANISEIEVSPDSVSATTETSENVTAETIEPLQDQLSRFQDENSDLKALVQQLRENIFVMNSGSERRKSESEGGTQQHRRSLSQVMVDGSANVEALRAELQQEQSRYSVLLARHDAIVEKEANLRRELERLRLHLVGVEEHYTTEAMETEQTLNECRAKLAGAEDQLRSSSTVYKSANVRSTQHVESLQSQIRLMSVQRDDLQIKLSAAEDQIQKHSASLASLQMVLEQFQLDKERELQAFAVKHEYQLTLAQRQVDEIAAELALSKDQLAEAKNGLKAALRLGEQLEKKSQQITALEELVNDRELELLDAKKRLETINESSSGKIDKSLVKNLVLGYLGGAQGTHKTQALKILASVLELSEDERAKAGVDDQGGWLSHLLHPRSEAAGESLSQAFVRFLESESRPHLQLKLLPEATGEGTAAPKRAPLLLSDFDLPSVTPTQVTESSDSVLNDVLKGS